MDFKRLSGAMLAAALAVTVVAQPLCAQPSKPMACCGKSCPPPPAKTPADCCRMAPAPSTTATIASVAPSLIAWAIVAISIQPQAQPTSRVLRDVSDSSPPGPDRLTVSGLSPPSLA